MPFDMPSEVLPDPKAPNVLSIATLILINPREPEDVSKSRGRPLAVYSQKLIGNRESPPFISEFHKSIAFETSHPIKEGVKKGEW
jgi:hypothetical protein